MTLDLPKVKSEILDSIEQLISIVAQLRSPEGGCPWDLAQTPETLIPHIIEEAYEVVDAIREGNPQSIVEELGDLLLQVILQAQIASEQNHFTLQEISQGITEKLIRRHPHVFGDLQVSGIEEIHRNWEKIKAQEKGISPEQQQQLSYQLHQYTRKLPPLMASTKLSKKLAKAGFEWENIEGVWDKFQEELQELHEALETDDHAHQQAELGDLLFTVVQVARWHDLDPSEALNGTNQRVIQRMKLMEKFATKPLGEYTLNELDELWNQAKKYIAKTQE